MVVDLWFLVGAGEGADDGIEPALSAWESERNTPSQGLTCQLVCPVVAALRRFYPLMAR
jgi:hypothetical protein